MYRIGFVVLLFVSPLIRCDTPESSPEARIAVWEAEGLPVAPLWERLREGRAKNVSDEVILEALDLRARHLREARGLLEEQSFSLRSPVVQDLWTTVARVREGGMPPHMIEELLSKAGGQSAGRLISLLEAGETFQLVGMDEETSRMLMTDFFQRSLTRSELLRASRSARQLYAEGHRGEALLLPLYGHGPGRGRGPPEGRGGNGMRRHPRGDPH
ncbi:MAG: hypothetical protein JJU29_10475 [Verrucomicrobia bacterium]|nr:hypothetical protein [Verrucomicrobiota bacterium]MCH8512265.1 hypothetical protein [Kiritimatiellia bacterium]